MSILSFNAKEIKPLIEHARKCQKHSATFGMLFDKQYWKQGVKPKEEWAASDEIDDTKIPAGLHLVHDQGIYLMSNGTPRQLVSSDSKSSIVVYEKDCNPNTPDDWWDTARRKVGGDDFAEHVGLDWWDAYIKRYPRMEKPFRIRMNKDSMSLVL